MPTTTTTNIFFLYQPNMSMISPNNKRWLFVSILMMIWFPFQYMVYCCNFSMGSMQSHFFCYLCSIIMNESEKKTYIITPRYIYRQLRWQYLAVRVQQNHNNVKKWKPVFFPVLKVRLIGYDDSSLMKHLHMETYLYGWDSCLFEWRTFFCPIKIKPIELTFENKSKHNYYCVSYLNRKLSLLTHFCFCYCYSSTFFVCFQCGKKMFKVKKTWHMICVITQEILWL